MKTYFTILFIGITLTLSGQIISGTITDTENNPLWGVQVYIADLQKGTTTDEHGYYILKGIPMSTIELSVSYFGFEKQSIRLSLIDNETIQDFQLKESVFKMDEVILSTPFNKLQTENVMKVDKATVQLFRQRGAISLVDGLQTMPGVSQMATGTGIGKPVIRGLRGNRVLIYTQDIRLENQQYGDEHGLGIHESTIEDVEVIKGPASLLYGSDALGGVIYFNPIKFADENTFRSSVEQSYYSNSDGHQTAVTLKKTFESWKFLAQAAQTNHSDYKMGNSLRVTNTRYSEKVLNGGIGYSSDWFSGSLRFNLNRSKIGIPVGTELQNTNKSPFIPYQDLQHGLYSLNTTIFMGNSKLSTILGYSQNQRKEFEDEEGHDHGGLPDSTHPALHAKLNTFSYNLKWHLPKKTRFETLVGLQGLTQDNKNHGEEILIPDATTKDIGLYLTNFYKWNSNSLQGGLRVDNRQINSKAHEVIHDNELHITEAMDKSYTQVSVSLGLKTELFNTVATRFNMATGFRAPTLAELTSDGVHHGTNRFEHGNPTLTSEKNYQFDLALELDSDHFETYANGFYNNISDYIFLAPSEDYEDGYQIFNFIQGNSYLYGGEFGIHLHPHPLDWLHLHGSYEFVVGKQKDGNYLPLIPANKISTTLRTEFEYIKFLKKPFASMSFEYVSKQKKVSEFETSTPGYGLWKVALGGLMSFEKFNIDLSMNINNILNTKYISHLSRLKSDNLYNMGRNLVIKAKISI